MDDIYSSSDRNRRSSNRRPNSKQAFEDLFSDSLAGKKRTNDEYFERTSRPPRNPRFTEYEDISSGRDEFEEIEEFPRFEEVSRSYSDDIMFEQRTPYNQPVYYEEDDDVLTSPFVHGDDYGYAQQPPTEYENINTTVRRNSQLDKKPDRKNRNGDRKKGKAGKVIISILLVFVILFGCVFGYAFSLAARLNHENDLGHDNPHISSAELMSDSRVKNILLIGVDKAEGGASRSDTNMLLSIDKNNKKIKLISFMRDYWVEIPGNGSAKLNAACAYGGPELTVYTIEKNFGIKIDGFAMVDFDIFISIIDALGGIEVEVTEKEAEFMRNQVTWTDVQAGESVLLNGKEALLYCRIRKLDSDFMRTERQRKMITALINKMASAEIVKILPSLNEVLPQITTNMPSLNLTFTAFGAIGWMGYEIEQMQVPFEDTWSYGTMNGQSVLVADIEQQRQKLREYMYTTN